MLPSAMGFSEFVDCQGEAMPLSAYSYKRANHQSSGPSGVIMVYYGG